MNFGQLKANILELIGRAPASVCYELVTADINQEMRLRIMEASTTVTESAEVLLPDDFLEIVSIYRDVNPRTILKPITPQQLHDVFQSSGTPAFYAIEDEQIRLAPSPNGSESIVIRYYAEVDSLTLDADKNVVLTKYPSIYVYGVLAHHAALIRDQQSAAMWLAAYEKAKKQARADDQKYRYGGAPIVPTARATA